MPPSPDCFRSHIAVTLGASLLLLACRPVGNSPGGGVGAEAGSTASGEGGARAGGGDTQGGGGSTETGGIGNSNGGNGDNNGSGGKASGGADAGTPTDAAVPSPLAVNHVMTCDTPPLAVPTQHIEAECAFGPTTGQCKGTTGGQQGTQTENNGTDVGFIEGGDSLWYAGVMMDGINAVTLHYAKGVDGGTIEVHLDSATGQLLGTFKPVSTGSWTTWQSGTAALSAASGSHTLYLVAAGSTAGILNLDWIELSASSSSGSTRAPHRCSTSTTWASTRMGPKQARGRRRRGPGPLFTSSASDGTRRLGAASLTGVPFSAWGSSQIPIYAVDFTELTRPGTYRLQVGSFTSGYFEIADQLPFRHHVSWRAWLFQCLAR
jgi:hypothetical protein